ncbi:MAG: hypothetical protein O2783_01030 [Chloroflexi bacterium]|nr:hypothetical protein [Chloroflexota bacterium]
MTSAKKVAANKRNASKSTGPRDTSKTRFNPVTHGILTSPANLTNVFGKEEAALLRRITRRFFIELAPVGILEQLEVEKLALYTIRYQRALRFESDSIMGKKEGHHVLTLMDLAHAAGMPRKDDDEDESFSGVSPDKNGIRYETSLERGYGRSLDGLRQLQIARLGRQPVYPAAPNDVPRSDLT